MSRGTRKAAAEQSRYGGIPPGDMRLVADELGPDVARKLMHKLGGLKLYIPRSETYRRWYVEVYFTGNNQTELAIELGVTESTIQSYVKKMYKRPEERQPSLFGANQNQ